MADSPPDDSPKMRRKRALKMARVYAGRSVQEAAAAVGKSRQTYSSWERLTEETAVPDDEDIEKLAPFFGVSIEQLQSGEWITAYTPGEPDHRLAPLMPEGDWARVPLPRHARNLPLSAREFLARVELELIKSGVLEEELAEAMRLLKSPEVFSFYQGGTPRDFNEEQVLMGMRAIYNGVVKPELKRRGRKL